MTEKEILYQYLSREIDNIIANLIPGLSMFANPVKKYVFNYIDPYVDLFFMGGDKLNTDAVRKYATQEVTTKINDFIDKFEKERSLL